MNFDKSQHTIVETTNVNATQYAAHIKNVEVPKALDNGSVGYLGDLVKGENDIHEFETPTAELIANDKESVYMLIHTHEYDDGTEAMYSHNKGDVVRAYTFINDDIITISSDGLEGVAEEGKFVTLEADSNKLTVADEKPETDAFYGIIQRIKSYPVALRMGVENFDGDTKMVEIMVKCSR